MASKKSIKATASTKKEFRKELAAKIEFALPELKIKLGDKEFQHRVKKATKILAQGLRFKDVSKNNDQPKKENSKKLAGLKKVKKIKSVAEPDARQNL